MFDCCCFPVHLVLFGSCMYCDAVLHIVSLHCFFVFTYPLLLCSSCFSNVDTLAFGAWYLVHNSFLLPLWLGSFVYTKASLRIPFGLKVVLMPRHLHLLSILSLTPLTYGKWRNLGVVVCSCSSVRVEGCVCVCVWVVPESLVHYISVLGTHLLGRLASGGSILQSCTLVAWQTFLALVPRHLMMLVLILAWWWES